MMAHGIPELTFVAALGSGLIAGIFFTFSSFVMPALSARPAAESIAAMQSINVKVLNVSFLGTFFGTALLAVALIVLAAFDSDQPGTTARLIASALYLVGTLGVTVACNVPRNDALAQLDPDAAGAENAWAVYDRTWTAWNTVRTVAAFGAMATFMAA